jgi:NADPH:quinone reductase-like Zn-dependent oxidoreductase
MNAVGIEGGEGPAEALKLVTLPTPKLGVGQTLVRVAAAGVNQHDLVQREGRYPLPPGTPETMGLEIAGEVMALAHTSRLSKKIMSAPPVANVCTSAAAACPSALAKARWMAARSSKWSVAIK